MLSPTHIALLYFVYFWGHGIDTPYLAVAMQRAGMTGTGIGVAMALALAIQVAIPPLWGWVADRWGGGARLLLIGALGSLLGTALAAGAALVPSLAGYLAGMLIFALMRTPVSPLLDAFTLAQVGSRGFGRVRRWGSVGFVVGAFSTGLVVDHLGAPALTGLMAATWALLVALALTLKLGSAPIPSQPVALEPSRLYGQRAVWAFLAVSAVHSGCGVPYDTYFAIHAAKVGLPGYWVGTAWALGVTLEVLVLTHLDALIARLGPKRLLVIAYLTGLVRWTLTAAIPSGIPLALVQTVHGISFGAFFGASVVWMNRVVPHELRASAQSVFAAVVWGGGGIAAQLIAGPVFERYGGHTLFAGSALLEMVPILALMALPEPPPEC